VALHSLPVTMMLTMALTMMMTMMTPPTCAA
jgi:hypothetical protein